jgi:hypothetical protein
MSAAGEVGADGRIEDAPKTYGCSSASPPLLVTDG